MEHKKTGPVCQRFFLEITDFSGNRLRYALDTEKIPAFQSVTCIAANRTLEPNGSGTTYGYSDKKGRALLALLPSVLSVEHYTRFWKFVLALSSFLLMLSCVQGFIAKIKN